MKILAHIGIALAYLLGGSVLGTLGGMLLGWILAFGYHKHGLSDPGDAPAYVTLGLMMLGACIGAIVGLVVAVIYSIRLVRRVET